MTEPVLAVRDLTVTFQTPAAAVVAVGSVSFELGRERLALVGQSGSGKSVTARALINLLPRQASVEASEMRLGDTDLRPLDAAGWSAVRGSRMGLVLQDPKFSLNPAQQVGRQVGETLLLHTRMSRHERRERVLETLAQVGLDDPLRVYRSYPGELSGGMGQRVMIAAMIINQPDLLIADEPTSALDRDLGDQVLGLLRRMADDLGMALLLISHDLRQVAQFTDRVLVMRGGIIVDRVPAAQLGRADHPYTRSLWEARPSAATYGTRLPVFAPGGDSQ